VLQNTIPHQYVMNTQQEINSAPQQMGQYPNLGPNQPRNLVDRNILLTTEEEILLQNHSRQYGVPLEYTPATFGTTHDTFKKPLMIPCPNTDPNPPIPCVPLRWNVHNPHARESHKYSLVDDLA
jgi:hypothetical protein